MVREIYRRSNCQRTSPSRWLPSLTFKQMSFRASSPLANVLLTAKNEAILTLSLAVDHRSKSTYLISD